MAQAAKVFLAAALAFLVLGFAMQRFRSMFEPVLSAVLPLLGRRGSWEYVPAHYAGYAVMPFVLAGIAVVFSFFAALFHFAKLGGATKRDDLA